MKTLLEVSCMVETLAMIFRVPAPSVTLTDRKNSAILWKTGQIRIARKDWHGVEAAVLHEFTHYLIWSKVGRHKHNELFFTSLRNVIALWWSGDVERYPWHKEYRGIWKLATEEGYTRRKWAGE